MKPILRLLAIIIFFAAPAVSKAVTIVGLTASNQLFFMSDPNTPSSVSGPYNITGVTSGQQLVAIDYRPSNGTLYALGYNSTNGTAQLYTINTANYSAAAVSSTTVSLQLGNGQSVGMDFNSTTSGTLTITGDNGNMYSMNSANATISGNMNTMSYASGDLFNGVANIGAAAYSNSFFGADGTKMMGYDLQHNTMVYFDASNQSTIHTMGLSGVVINTGSSVGMDIYYDPATHTNRLYLAARGALSGGSNLYTVNTTTGFALYAGAIGNGSMDVRDIAVRIDRNVPANISGQLMAALTLNMRHLVTFDSEDPATIRDMFDITGMTSGQTMMAIDFRPADMNLYGLGYNSTNSQYQLYRIDLTTGAAVAVNSTPATLNLGSNTAIGFDFDPVTDRIRVTGNNGMNVLLSASTGAVVATDSALSYGQGDINFGTNATITAIAYTNSYSGTTSSQLLGLDIATGSLVMLSGNGGSTSVLTTLLNVGTYLGGGSNNNGSMDFYYDHATNTNMGYMVSNEGSNANSYGSFYSMTSTGGSIQHKGDVGQGIPVQDIAARQTYNGVGIANVSGNSSDVLMYPNPARSYTIIELPDVPQKTVRTNVINMNGQVVMTRTYQPGNRQLQMDVSSIPVGLYNIEIREQDQPVLTQKLQKSE
jgi:hypothetical protein